MPPSSYQRPCWLLVVYPAQDIHQISAQQSDQLYSSYYKLKLSTLGFQHIPYLLNKDQSSASFRMTHVALICVNVHRWDGVIWCIVVESVLLGIQVSFIYIKFQLKKVRLSYRPVLQNLFSWSLSPFVVNLSILFAFIINPRTYELIVHEHIIVFYLCC